MKKYFDKVSKSTIVYFSGIGGTEMVANLLHKKLDSSLYNINNDNIVINDMLIVLFPVYAFNEPYLMKKFLKKIELGNNKPAVIISVSGGGEVFPNLASRFECKNILKKKHYNVVYEDMLIMPSALVIKTPDSIIKKLIEILPDKINNIVIDLKNSEIKLSKPPIGNIILSFFGKGERIGGRIYGRNIIVNSSCNGCSKCANNCSSKNIVMKNHKPCFGFKCAFCMKCLYNCDKNALSPRFMKKSVIEGGYNINDYKDIVFDEKEFNENINKKIWGDIKTYLNKK